MFKENSDIIGIIHFATAKAVEESVKNPLFYYRNNIIPLINLLEAMEEYHVFNLCISSISSPNTSFSTKLSNHKLSSKLIRKLSHYEYTRQISENIV